MEATRKWKGKKRGKLKEGRQEEGESGGEREAREMGSKGCSPL